MSDSSSLDAFQDALLRDDPAALYERAPCGFVSTAPDGTITKVNETFVEMTGFRRDELERRRTFAELLSGGGRIYHETHFAPTLQMEGRISGVALDLVGADGTRIPVLVHAVLERVDDHSPGAVRIATFDATERRQYEEELLRAKNRAEESEVAARRLARTLQQTLIPPSLPLVPGIDLAAEYRPAGSGELVGGDFYDLFQIGPDDWVIALGDVCGKGPDAAVVTALVRYTIRAAAVEHSSPAEVLGLVNEVILRSEDDRFCTAVVVRLRRSEGTWRATLSLAGHPLPLLARSGSAATTAGGPGSLLGVFHDAHYTDHELVLEPRDLLLVFTDGVTEGRSGQEFYGDERLQAVMDRHRQSAGALAAAVLEDVVSFQNGLPRDDIALFALHVPDTTSPPGAPTGEPSHR